MHFFALGCGWTLAGGLPQYARLNTKQERSPRRDPIMSKPLFSKLSLAALLTISLMGCGGQNQQDAATAANTAQAAPSAPAAPAIDPAQQWASYGHDYT